MRTSQSADPRYYTAQEAISRLSVSRTTFYNLVNSGRVTRVPRPDRKQSVYLRSEIDVLASLDLVREDVSSGAPLTPPEQLAPGARMLLNAQHRLLEMFTHLPLYTEWLRPPTTILEVGCGTGRWALSMAEQYRDADVIGVERWEPPLSSGFSRGAPAARPSQGQLEPTWRFERVERLSALPFPAGSCDLVSMRWQARDLPTREWSAVVAEMARVTRPGGWIECLELGLLEGDGPALNQLKRWEETWLRGRGVTSLPDERELSEYLRGAGLVNMRTRRIALPVDGDGDGAALYAALTYFQRLTQIGSQLMQVNGVSRATYAETLARAQREVTRSHCVWPAALAFAQGDRPDTSSDDTP